MSPEEIMFTELSPIFANRVFPEHLPEKAPLPACVYRRIGGRLHQSNCGTGITALMQLTIFSKETNERQELLRLVMLALSEYELGSAPMMNFDFFSKAHVVVVDYFVESAELV